MLLAASGRVDLAIAQAIMLQPISTTSGFGTLQSEVYREWGEWDQQCR
jgi:hypothetical protein